MIYPELTKDMRKKLRNLSDYMPNQKKIIYKFGEFLAERLDRHPSLFPKGFDIAAELALHDLRKKTDSFTGQPIKNDLTCLHSLAYVSIKNKILDIAYAVCPEDFAKGVRDFQEDIQNSMS